MPTLVPRSEVNTKSGHRKLERALFLSAFTALHDPTSSGPNRCINRPRLRPFDRNHRDTPCCGYLIAAPPSMGRLVPVMYRDSSEAKNSTALLTSRSSTQGMGMRMVVLEAAAKSSRVG